MQNSRLLVVFSFLALFISSCDHEKARMIKKLAGPYLLDTTKCDYKTLKNLIPGNLQVILSKDKSYYFSPAVNILKGYSGNWDISDDDEYSYFIFSCDNGQYQQVRVLSIRIEFHNKDYVICFKKPEDSKAIEVKH